MTNLDTNLNIALIIPTWNAASDLPALLASIKQQSLQPSTIFAIDSSSTDQTQQLLAEHNIPYHIIPQHEFNHGGTRKLGTRIIDAEIYLYITQDIILAGPDAFKNLIQGLLLHPNIGVAYARQLPKADANPINAHGRFKNYPTQSELRSLADKKQYGIKTCFNSDNLAAYRKQALIAIDGFPDCAMTAEDAYIAAKMLLHGFSIHYVAEAVIYHSHNLSLIQEFKRYFSLGVFHAHENWIIKHFSGAHLEGLRFIKSEWAYLWRQKQFHYFPKAILSTAVKYLAYRLGLHEQHIPRAIKEKWSINPHYWEQKKRCEITHAH